MRGAGSAWSPTAPSLRAQPSADRRVGGDCQVHQGRLSEPHRIAEPIRPAVDHLWPKPRVHHDRHPRWQARAGENDRTARQGGQREPGSPARSHTIARDQGSAAGGGVWRQRHHPQARQQQQPERGEMPRPRGWRRGSRSVLQPPRQTDRRMQAVIARDHGRRLATKAKRHTCSWGFGFTAGPLEY